MKKLWAYDVNNVQPDMLRYDAGYITTIVMEQVRARGAQPLPYVPATVYSTLQPTVERWDSFLCQVSNLRCVADLPPEELWTVESTPTDGLRWVKGQPRQRK